MPSKTSSKDQETPVGSAPGPITPVVSINGGVRHEDLALAAYFRWEARGCPDGSPDEDWSHAVQELNC